MWALISSDEHIIAKDFKSKEEALSYKKFYAPTVITINQNTVKYAMIEMRARRLINKQ